MSLSWRCEDQSRGEVNLLVRNRSVVLVGIVMEPKSQALGGSRELKQSTADLIVLN